MAKYDMYFRPVPAGNYSSGMGFEFGYKASLKVSGPPSLVNRWTKTFMTLKGSDPLDQTYGTGFPNLIGSNISSVSMDLADVVAIAITEANTQVYDQDLKGFFPSNERLNTATLTGFQQTADGIAVWVTITNMAGEALPVMVATV